MGKSSIVPIFKEYVRTLHGGDDCLRAQDVAVQLIAPAAVGIAVGALVPADAHEAVSASLPTAITAVSIVSAFMCAMAVMVFQLRIQVANAIDERGGDALSAKVRKGDLKLIDELFHDVMWSIVVGFASALCMTAACFLVGVQEIAFRILLGASAALLLNGALVVCMCLKRMNSSYIIVSRSWGR